jgi:hypothetical protein
VHVSADYPVPDIPNIKKWFCERSIVGLSYIKFTIDRFCINNSNVKDYLYVALAGIIRKVSNADEVSPKPYVSTRYPKTPAEPLELFFKVEAMYREAIKEFSDATRNNGCQSIILSGNDARTVSTFHDVDLGVVFLVSSIFHPVHSPITAPTFFSFTVKAIGTFQQSWVVYNPYKILPEQLQSSRFCSQKLTKKHIHRLPVLKKDARNISTKRACSPAL